ncbi:MAG: leucine-rich repeat domain-containing protein [Clostridia bacterium]|nr:leucine-rich repeat domain-containing protein [Clostridia bacterium]
MKLTFKKFISVIALLALVITSLTVFASCGSSAPADGGGTVGDITWKYVKDGNKLEIIGNPAEPVEISNYSTDARAPWYNYKDYITQISITGVSRIGDYAFYNLHYVTKIDLGSSLKEIGKFAFAFWGGLVTGTDENKISLTIPEGVTVIGDSAFECCSILDSVTLPHSLESLGDRAFAYNANLSKVAIPEAVKTANEDAIGSIFKKDLDADKNPVLPTIEAVAAPKPEEEKPAEGEAAESGAASDKPTEAATDAPAEEPTEAPTEEPTEAETEKESETEAAPQNKTTMIIAIVVLALVIICIIIGAILLMRSNKKIANDSRTVRKNDNSKKGKKK